MAEMKETNIFVSFILYSYIYETKKQFNRRQDRESAG